MWFRVRLVTVILLVPACAIGGAPVESAVHEGRISELMQLYPEGTIETFDVVARADRCPEGPRLEEPVSIGRVLSDLSQPGGGFVIVDDDSLQHAIADATPSGIEPDLQAVEVGSATTVLIDDAISGAQELAGQPTSWFVGIGTAHSVLAAIFDSGQIAFVNQCLFELRTLPIATLAAEQSLPPASLLESLADGDGQRIIEQLNDPE